MAQSSAAVSTDRKRTLGQQLRAFLSYEPKKRVKPQEVVLFCRQLSSFVRVGIPVITAIQTFAEQSTTEGVRRVYMDVASDLERGSRLSEAFAKHPTTFPPI